MSHQIPFGQICVGDVKDLGSGKFLVRLTVEGPEGSLSQTQTVSADGHDTAVQIAREAFLRWAGKAAAYAVKICRQKMRNSLRSNCASAAYLVAGAK
jgi:hypothetical protein